MEQSIPEIARKIWHIVRVTFFMLRKGICKRKILMDLNMMMKRGKIAGKALNNLLFHHHHHPTASYGSSHLSYSREYEFSCSNTPLYRHYFTAHKRKTHHHHNHHCRHYEAAAANIDDIDMLFEMMDTAAVEASPILPGLGFGRSPMVRQLRITDSPFLVLNADEDSHVDEAAEEFIQKFAKNKGEQKRDYN
ncbi:hypothetical protein Cgig2_009931 [Carnegiea gigantea]|uniref:Uncharacterized protein n=1 Tax=Carnegiea gigantea TaxID=171969 RepID=A0A9Q1JZI2_9CARY|nr:hypothetical protein Cgig2_009931 [Carnegiea gigantea]